MGQLVWEGFRFSVEVGLRGDVVWGEIKSRPVSATVLFVALIISQPVCAHTDESLDAMLSPHRGQVRAAGPYHLELVAKDGECLLYTSDAADERSSVDL